MYFEQEDVKRLLQDIRAAFSTSVIMFDTIPDGYLGKQHHLEGCV